MAYAWLPGAKRVRAATDGGMMNGGAPRAVWLTLGAEPRSVSACSAALRLNQEGCPCHLIWDPATGDVAQLIPVVRAGLALGTPERLDYVRDRASSRPAAANAEGRVCVQIGVLARPGDPFTRVPMTGLDAILAWLDSWDVPRRWPARRPLAFGASVSSVRSRVLWARGGHYGASQVPDCESLGPGDIDIERLTGCGVLHVPTLPAAPIPASPVPAALAGEDSLAAASAALRIARAELSSVAGRLTAASRLEPRRSGA